MYVNYSQKEGSLINFASYFFLTLVIFQLLIPLIRILAGYSVIDDFNNMEIITGAFIYAIFGVVVMFTFLHGLRKGRMRKKCLIPLFNQPLSNSFLKLFVFVNFFTIFLLLMLIIQSFSLFDILNNPRYFYSQTRSGFGHLYFTIIFLLKLNFILILSLTKKSFMKYIVLLTTVMIFYLFFGSKSQIVIIILIFLLHQWFFSGRGYNIYRLKFLGIFSLVFFIFTFLKFHSEEFGFFVGFLLYFDYFDNFIKLFIDFKNFYYGYLAIESNLYTPIPRALWEDKPLHFGVLRLSEEIFPLQAQNLAGHASLSIFGRAYGDFGIFALIYFPIVFYAQGYFLGNLSNHKFIPIFIIVLSLSFLPLISVGSDAFIVIIANMIFSFLLIFLYKILIILGKKDAS